MIVYEYLRPESITVLKNGLLRFTQPSALNDPFEANPVLSDMRRFFTQLVEALPESNVDEAAESAQQAITETFGRWSETNASNLAFLCLSKNRTQPLMWAHYCDSHRGFVMGFDSTNSFFSVARPGSKSDLKEVRYVAERPIMPAPDGESIEFLREKTNVLTKSTHWSYEEEVRMFADLSAADDTKHDRDGNPIYLLRFPAQSLREVIIGHKTPEDVREEIKQIVREKYCNARLFTALPSDSGFDLDIHPLS